MMHSPYFGSEARSAAGGSGKGQQPSSGGHPRTGQPVKGQPGRGHHRPRAEDSPADGKSGGGQSPGGLGGHDADRRTEGAGQRGVGVRRDTLTLDPQELLSSASAIHILGDGLACDYTRAFRAAEADRLLQDCEKQIEYMTDEEARVRVFGAWHSLPRQQSAYGDPSVTYRYSGSTLLARPWCPVLAEIRARVESLTEQRYNFVLVNRYRDGRDHMGEHRDDEKELVHRSAITSVSLGACRHFCFRRGRRRGRRSASASRGRGAASEDDRATNGTPPAPRSPAGESKRTGESDAEEVAITVRGDRLVLPLEHGSVLVMRWPTNEQWSHALPPRRRDRNVRVNLTFRLVRAAATPAAAR